MSESKKVYRRLTVDEKKAKLEAEAQKFDKISEEYKAKAAAKRAQIAELDKPVVTVKDVSDRIKALGIAPEEVMKALDKMAAKKQ